MEIRNNLDELIAFTLGETNARVDLSFEVRIICGKYSCTQGLWIMCEDWESFVHQLESLEASRQGRAELRGITERDLKLHVRR